MSIHFVQQAPLQLRFHFSGGTAEPQAVLLDQVLIASWTGRDPAVVEARISELERLGIARPPNVPMLYQIAKSRVTNASSVQVVGGHSTGEVEFVLLSHQGRLWVGVGSDHTDRALEQHDAALSKQLCEKPIAGEFWCLDDVENHWDSLQLRSFVHTSEGGREQYQAGTVASMLHPQDLVKIRDAATASEKSLCSLLFCGTLPTIGPIRGGVRFDIELIDPVLNRSLSHSYAIETLPSHLPPLAGVGK